MWLPPVVTDLPRSKPMALEVVVGDPAHMAGLL